jgi:hypothetical protein
LGLVKKQVRVYNFTVATLHTYFVGGKQQWLVHNISCPSGVDPAHWDNLGKDYERGGKFNDLEADAALRIENTYKVKLTRFDSKSSSNRTGDWIDNKQPVGRTWDAVGPLRDASHFNLASFTSQIEKHVSKQGLDIVIVDYARLTSSQIIQIEDYILSKPHLIQEYLNNRLRFQGRGSP